MIMNSPDSISEKQKFNTGKLKFLTEYAKINGCPQSTSIKEQSLEAPSMKVTKSNISRNDISKIQKKNILSRISDINLSLISIFDSIWEKCNGNIAEFSF